MKKIKVALLGLGTVGGGTYRILCSQHDKIARDYGIDIEVAHILERDLTKVEALGVNPAIVSTDINNILENDEISIVAEFFGGIEPARTFLLKSLEAGKSIVTANKELFSKHWTELEAAATKGNAGLYFEASCVGGVPIIRTLHDGMQGNDILSMMGIVNGTTNYILTKMSEEGWGYADALREAQRLGYAEFNPTADVDGFDASYKLSILSTLAYKQHVPVSVVRREGISSITAADISYAKEMGYSIKLLAISKCTDGIIEARVHPTLVPVTHPLAGVRDSFNAVYLTGNNVGDIMLYGRGAGDLPTGSAIVSDIVYAAGKTSHTRYPALTAADAVCAEDFESKYYVRLTAQNRSGVLARIADIFGKYGISIVTLLQKDVTDVAPIIIVTQETKDSAITAAALELQALDCITAVDNIIKVI